MSGVYERTRVVVRGAGEMASGVIFHLHKAGYETIALEQPNPTCVRRFVSFAEAVYEKEIAVEDITAVLTDSVAQIERILSNNKFPILIDSDNKYIEHLKPEIYIDGRMRKRESDCSKNLAPIVIGLGPGFSAGDNCHAVVETNQGQFLGRVILEGTTQAATGIPCDIDGFSLERLLRAPADGLFLPNCEIADSVSAGQVVGQVGTVDLISQIGGFIRGLIRDGLTVKQGQKLGDIDPRGDKTRCYKIGTKANAIGAGVLEAIDNLKSL